MLRRCGNSGEVRLLRDQRQPYNVFDWDAGAVHGHRRRERERVVWNGLAASAFGCIRSRFLPRPLPHHCLCISDLHPGPLSLTPFLSPSLFVCFRFRVLFNNVSLPQLLSFSIYHCCNSSLFTWIGVNYRDWAC